MRKIGLMSLLITVLVVIYLLFTMNDNKDKQQSQNEVRKEGQANTDVQVEKGLLDGYTIVLDPGHGGKDGGAVGVNGTIEKDITYLTAEHIKQELQKHDAIVQFTRMGDRKSTRLNSSHVAISYAVFCLKKKNKQEAET